MTRIKFKAAVIIQSRGFCPEKQSFHGRIFVFAQLVRQIDVFPDELQIPINGVFLLSPNLTDSISSKRLRIIPPCKSFFVQIIEQGKWRSRGLWGRFACSMQPFRPHRAGETPFYATMGPIRLLDVLHEKKTEDGDARWRQRRQRYAPGGCREATGGRRISPQKKTPEWTSCFCGDSRSRTDDPLLAKQML